MLGTIGFRFRIIKQAWHMLISGILHELDSK